MVNRSQLFARPEVKNAIATMRDILRAAMREGSFGEREAEALAMSDEAVRAMLRDELQAISDRLGDEVLVDGVAYERHEPGTDTYHSLCGPLEIKRPSYRRMGGRNGSIVIALEWAAGLIEGATPALAYSITHGYAQHDMRVHLETLQAARRHAPSRTTLERPVDAPAKAERKRRHPRQRCAPPCYDINWRMAYVGTVCFVDANGDALATLRYASAACDDPRELVQKMAADVKAALKRRPSLNVGSCRMEPLRCGTERARVCSCCAARANGMAGTKESIAII